MSSSTGYLKVIIGPMTSGKTTKALNEAIVKAINHSVLYVTFKGSNDRAVEGGDTHNFTSHNSLLKVLPGSIFCFCTLELSTVDVSEYDVILVDESNFYQDLVVSVMKWLSMNKYIIVVGLDGDYKQEKFGQVLDLIPICDDVKKISAECSLCKTEYGLSHLSHSIKGVPAPFSKRNVKSDEIELIGGTDIYTAVCRKHL